MDQEVLQLLGGLNLRRAIDRDVTDRLEEVLGLPLPNGYREFLSEFDGGEGWVGQAYLILWGEAELLEGNKALSVDEFLPGCILFGSDGGGMAYGFIVSQTGSEVMTVPYIPMDLSEAEVMGGSFREFLETLALS